MNTPPDQSCEQRLGDVIVDMVWYGTVWYTLKFRMSLFDLVNRVNIRRTLSNEIIAESVISLKMLSLRVSIVCSELYCLHTDRAYDESSDFRHVM